MLSAFRFRKSLTVAGFCGTLLPNSLIPNILTHIVLPVSAVMIAANGLSSSKLLRRFPMRFPQNKVVATYSHTDDQVRFLVKFSLLTGCGIGGIIVGAVMRAFN